MDWRNVTYCNVTVFPFFSLPLRHRMASQLWAVLCQHPAWLLTLHQPKCHPTWPTVLLLLAMLLDMGGNMLAAPHCLPTTVTFLHHWLSRECRQPEKAVILLRPLHSDGSFHSSRLALVSTLSKSSLSSPHPPLAQPYCLKSWLYGFIIFVLMTLKYFLL